MIFCNWSIVIHVQKCYYLRVLPLKTSCASWISFVSTTYLISLQHTLRLRFAFIVGTECDAVECEQHSCESENFKYKTAAENYKLHSAHCTHSFDITINVDFTWINMKLLNFYYKLLESRTLVSNCPRSNYLECMNAIDVDVHGNHIVIIVRGTLA